jgi:hypothetical protein
MRNISDKIVEKIKTPISDVTTFSKMVLLMSECGKIM